MLLLPLSSFFSPLFFLFRRNKVKPSLNINDSGREGRCNGFFLSILSIQHLITLSSQPEHSFVCPAVGFVLYSSTTSTVCAALFGCKRVNSTRMRPWWAEEEDDVCADDIRHKSGRTFVLPILLIPRPIYALTLWFIAWHSAHSRKLTFLLPGECCRRLRSRLLATERLTSVGWLWSATVRLHRSNIKNAIRAA